MTDLPDQFDDQLERFLDGQLSEAERAAFERQLQANPTCRAAADLQRRIDQSLCKQFAPPPPAALRPRVPTLGATNATNAGRLNGRLNGAVPPTATPRRPRRWGRWPLAVAASLLLATTGVWQIWRVAQPAPAHDYGPWRSMSTVFHDTVRAGFEPQWVCENDQQFQSSFRNHLGQSLSMTELPADLRALGLSYYNTLSPQTVCLLAEADGQPVMVFVDRMERDRAPAVAPGLHLHRRQLSRLVLYECSEQPQPVLLERFVIPGEVPTSGATEASP